jgi:hypothetical protein
MGIPIATAPIPRDLEERFPGAWIAVRDGNVVTSASSLEQLLESGVVRETDVLYRVPSSAVQSLATP